MGRGHGSVTDPTVQTQPCILEDDQVLNGNSAKAKKPSSKEWAIVLGGSREGLEERREQL